jgi:hypothetical protein
MKLRYSVRYLQDDLFRMSVFWHRHADAYLATAQQSGTHWLSNLLAAAMCQQYELPPLKNIADKLIIGHPRDPVTYPSIPRLVRTHNAPSVFVHSPPARALVRFPKYVVLVRDLRASLVSKYEKRKHEIPVPFTEYLRDHRMFGRAHKWDLYKRIVFFNAWGRVQRLMPDQTCVVHYEHLRRDTSGELERVWRFLGLPVGDTALFQRAADACRKERMSEKEAPDRTRNLVRMDDRDPVEWFSNADRTYFSACCRKLLKHSFGYDFNRWETAKALPDAGPTLQRRAA